MFCFSIFGSEKAKGNSWLRACLQTLVITGHLKHAPRPGQQITTVLRSLSTPLILWGFWPFFSLKGYNVWSSADICLWFFVVNYTTMILYECLNPQSLKL